LVNWEISTRVRPVSTTYQSTNPPTYQPTNPPIYQPHGAETTVPDTQLSDDLKLSMYRQMLTIRRFEERCNAL